MVAVESMLGEIVPVLLLAAVLVSGGLVHAQESRPAPAGVPAAPSAAAAFEKSKIAEKVKEIHKKITATGFYPTIRGLAAGTGIGPGLTFWKARPFGGPIGILATIGWNPRVLLVEGRVGRVPARPGDIPDRRFSLEALTTDPLGGSNHRWFAFLEARSVDIKTDSLFFTFGPDGEPQPVKFSSATRFLDRSPESGTVPFDVINSDLDLVAGYHFRRGVAASTRVGYVRSETTFDPEELDGTPGLPPIPGVNDTTDFARVRVDAIFDRRDVRNRAHRGTLVHATWLRMDQRGGTLYGFDRFELDLRGFVSTRSKRHTLAVRLTGTYDEREEGKVVPFYFQRSLGGSHTLRSYPLFRFRGTRRQAFSVEYRLALLRFLELAAFYDGGKAWGGVEALGSQGYRDSAGASARWVPERDVIARAFGAYGGEGWRFSVAGSFPF